MLLGSFLLIRLQSWQDCASIQTYPCALHITPGRFRVYSHQLAVPGKSHLFCKLHSLAKAICIQRSRPNNRLPLTSELWRRPIQATYVSLTAVQYQLHDEVRFWFVFIYERTIKHRPAPVDCIPVVGVSSDSARADIIIIAPSIITTRLRSARVSGRRCYKGIKNW